MYISSLADCRKVLVAAIRSGFPSAGYMVATRLLLVVLCSF